MLQIQVILDKKMLLLMFERNVVNSGFQMILREMNMQILGKSYLEV